MSHPSPLGAGRLPLLSDRATRRLVLALAVVFVVLAARLFWFTSVHAVNIFFWDQWDFLDPYFTGGGLFDRLWRQHGPHRQGLGAVVTSAVYALTGWNSRAEAFTVSGILLLAAVLATWTKIRVTGRVHAFDALIPLLFLTSHQWEVFAGAVNPAHGSLPLLLAVAMSLAQTVESDARRIGLTATLGILAVYTGFAFFLGLVAPVVLALETLRSRSPKVRLSAALACTATVLAIGVFFVGYAVGREAGCLEKGPGTPLSYIRFVGEFLLERTTLILPRGWSSTAIAVGAVAGFAAVAVSGWRTALGGNRRGLCVAVPVSFVLLFGAATATGRLCEGLDAPLASRYVPYVTAAWFGVYLWLAQRFDVARWPRDVLLVLAIVLLLGERADRSSRAEFLSSVKSAWRACYLETHRIDECTTRVGFGMHPNPVGARLQEKLDLLERHRLNLFVEGRR